MTHQRKHDRDDKRDRWEAQRWQEQRDEADKPPPVAGGTGTDSHFSLAATERLFLWENWMKERPILFSGAMARALLDGSKTQTRRVVKPKRVPDGNWMVETRGNRHELTHWDNDTAETELIDCPYGQPGDRLWVRETWRGIVKTSAPWDDCTTYDVAHYVPDEDECRRLEYAATFGEGAKGWRPSIHMPRWASRITLEITEVRVERLQDISEADAMAEGITYGPTCDTEGRSGGFHWDRTREDEDTYPTAAQAYRQLWMGINGPGSWDANPWVWVVEFKPPTTA